MKSNLEPVFADCAEDDAANSWAYWAPALMAASLASWTLVIAAARFAAALL